ncbi:protein of unknown function [Paenibacillus alvei]|uniref:Uncharacterized protein n=1 Tax=Paenibacillus alvei TaxID=44250 RepID=A0A383RHR9_PAEAL|nr:protein of unknown function [Paenibacillus alvei]
MMLTAEKRIAMVQVPFTNDHPQVQHHGCKGVIPQP